MGADCPTRIWFDKYHAKCGNTPSAICGWAKAQIKLRSHSVCVFDATESGEALSCKKNMEKEKVRKRWGTERQGERLKQKESALWTRGGITQFPFLRWSA